MKKKDLKQFPMIEFALTPSQRAKLVEWRAEIEKGFVSDRKDTRRSVLADVGILSGNIKCFLLQRPQAEIVNRAIMRARRSLEKAGSV